MSVVGSQRQTFLRLAATLRPDWTRDAALPTRIQSLLAQNKAFGSRDRKLYRELIFTALRHLPWIEPLLDHDPERAVKIVAWLAADTRATASFRRETAGDWPELTTLAERAAFLSLEPTALLPDWFRPECPALFVSPELDYQLQRAPVWLRLQTDAVTTVREEFDANGWINEASPILPEAWRLLVEADVTKAQTFARGAFEIQDLGSQLLLETIGVATGERWLDACAGAGGKTLQLAHKVGLTGHVDAYDIRPSATDELRERVTRARLTNVRTTAPSSEAHYDGVLVDAPCSGSGTWRRAPHLKWSTTPEVLTQRAQVQATLLDRYARHVRAGGRLVYATCSLARRENESVVGTFLAAHPEFESAPFAHTFGFTPSPEGLTLLPSRHNTDGFFVASLRRRA